MAASVGVKKQGEGLQNQIQTPKEGAAPMGGGHEEAASGNAGGKSEGRIYCRKQSTSTG